MRFEESDGMRTLPIAIRIINFWDVIKLEKCQKNWWGGGEEQGEMAHYHREKHSGAETWQLKPHPI